MFDIEEEEFGDEGFGNFGSRVISPKGPTIINRESSSMKKFDVLFMKPYFGGRKFIVDDDIYDFTPTTTIDEIVDNEDDENDRSSRRSRGSSSSRGSNSSRGSSRSSVHSEKKVALDSSDIEEIFHDLDEHIVGETSGLSRYGAV